MHDCRRFSRKRNRKSLPCNEIKFSEILNKQVQACMIRVMANRDPETATLFSHQKLEAMAEEFVAASKTLFEAAEIAKTNNGLASFNAKSGDLAVDRVQSFCKAIAKAIYAVKTNQPFEVGELKPRSTAKKPSLEMAKEAKAKAVKAFGRKKPQG